MDLQKEFSHALHDGLGRATATRYELFVWNAMSFSAIAYSHEDKRIILLLLRSQNFFEMTGDEYLEAAKAINGQLGCFCAPAQELGSHTLWAGKTEGPVYAYKFNVFNRPTKFKII